MQPKAVKVWEALKYHMDKGVDIMSDIDDIPGLHAYIAINKRQDFDFLLSKEFIKQIGVKSKHHNVAMMHGNLAAWRM